MVVTAIVVVVIVIFLHSPGGFLGWFGCLGFAFTLLLLVSLGITPQVFHVNVIHVIIFVAFVVLIVVVVLLLFPIRFFGWFDCLEFVHTLLEFVLFRKISKQFFPIVAIRVIVFVIIVVNVSSVVVVLFAFWFLGWLCSFRLVSTVLAFVLLGLSPQQFFQINVLVVLVTVNCFGVMMIFVLL
eukprot:Nitzschia sp. Nitz4//scaffold124_size66437//2658//3224//NITZ4_006101-RA/size66437-exonerate_est2genome-gene-0.73-mRNA-1//-1//CDS//3329534522//3199//frame0